MWLIALVTLAARMDLIVQRVILLLFPTMGTLASVFILAALDCIVLHKCFHLPVRALFYIIFVEMWLSPVVLPIMGIDTNVSGMRSVTVRAPYCLKVKHIEVAIHLVHQVKKVYSELFFWMSEGTHVSILTLVYLFWIALTKLDFILFGVVEFLNSVVCTWACFLERAVIILSRINKWANFTRVKAQLPSFILWWLVVVEALLRVVRCANRAMLSLEL